MNIEKHMEDSRAGRSEDTVGLQDGMSTAEATDSSNHPFVGKAVVLLAVFEMLLMFVLEAAAFSVPHIVVLFNHTETQPAGDHILPYNDRLSFSLMMYLHAGVWLIILLCDIIYSIYHRKLKMAGYLRLYRGIKYLQKHPFYVKSFGVTVHLALNSFFFTDCIDSSSSCDILSLTPMSCVQILVSIETAAMTIGLIIFMGKICERNRGSRVPDDVEERMLMSFRHGLDDTNGIGYKAGESTEDIIEYQADKIRVLTQQVEMLNKKLYDTSQHLKQASQHRLPSIQ